MPGSLMPFRLRFPAAVPCRRRPGWAAGRWAAGLAWALAGILFLTLLQPLPWLAEPPGVWVTLDGRRVLEIRSAPGAQQLQALGQRASLQLRQLADDHRLAPEQLVVQEDPPYSMVGLQLGDGRFLPRLGVDDRAARAFGLPRRELAERYRDELRFAIRHYRSSHTPEAWLRGTALALLVLVVYVLWLRWQCLLNVRLRRWLSEAPSPWLQGLRIGATQLLDGGQERDGLQWLRATLHWVVLALVSYLLIPLLLGLFPPTQAIAEGLRVQLLTLLLGFSQKLVQLIPNLLTIAVILAISALVIRASNSWFVALERGRLRLPGFYPEWARPTGRMVAVLILLAALVIAYPYVPGSGSKVFQGAGLFVGLLAALGSSSIAANILSGLMLIYTRGFREGDRVLINGVLGVVQERALLVTRIQTDRFELVSIPNSTVIGTSVTNYSFSRREIQRPVAIATTITIGYDVPWRQVHALMLAAAQQVEGIAAEPAAYVLQLSLNDFHISYELNASLADVGQYRGTLSELLGAIQDQFAAAGVEILSPGYHSLRDGTPSTLPRA
jgi:small-conductance mechanosensitive channel